VQRLPATPTLPAPGGARSRFGRSMSISANGATLIVGAAGNGSPGEAQLYTRSGSAWASSGPALTDSEPVDCAPEEEEPECRFGSAVAISGNGETAIVGVPGADGGQGAVSVFTHSAAGWSQSAELHGEEGLPRGTRFGRALALSFDGKVALVASGPNRQRAWVFTRDGGEWSASGEPLSSPEPEANDQFGRSVALSSDGATALIGAPGSDEGSGGAWIFTHSDEGWLAQTPMLTSGEAAGEAEFGRSVALSGDGTTALIGAPHVEAKAGAAWAFTRSGETWDRQTPALRPPSEAATAQFGNSVALSGDGTTALIGAPGYDLATGAVWELARSGSDWSEEAILEGAEANVRSWLGATVALSADGGTGVTAASIYESRAGGVWSLFTAPIETGEPEPEPEPPPSEPEPTPSATGATNGAPSSAGSARIEVLASGPEVSPPVLGKTGNLLPVSGAVLVKLPGGAGYVTVKGLTTIPFGTIVDATHGKVTLTTIGPDGRPQTITFYAGAFIVLAGHGGRVIAVLAGGSYASCPTAAERQHRAHASATRSSHGKVVRKLWAEGHGSYSTKGSYAAGAVQGTRWFTEDRCDGTLIRVATDRVLVTNLVTGRHRSVTAGHSYFAAAP
jgi:hypothetical protein